MEKKPIIFIFICILLIILPTPSRSEVAAFALNPHCAVDIDGNLVFTGYVNADVDLDPDPSMQIMAEEDKHFLVKYDPDNNLVFATEVGITEHGVGYSSTGIACDSNGNIFVCGNFYVSMDFDPSDGVDSHDPQPSFSKARPGVPQRPLGDCFLTKFGPDGDYLGTVTWGGESFVYCDRIFITDDDTVIVQGHGRGIFDLDEADGEFIVEGISRRELSDGSVREDNTEATYISWFNADGEFQNGVAWIDSSSYPEIRGFDADGNIWLGGIFTRPFDADPGDGETFLESVGNQYLAIIKLSPDGQYINSTTWDMPVRGSASSFLIDTDGDVLIAGTYTDLNNLPSADTLTLATPLPSNHFVLKYDSDCNLLFETFIEGADNQISYGSVTDIELNADGLITCTGRMIPAGDMDEFMDNIFSQDPGLLQTGFSITLTADGELINVTSGDDEIAPPSPLHLDAAPVITSEYLDWLRDNLDYYQEEASF